MPRDVYYQSSANPLQAARLPGRVVETAFPHLAFRGRRLFFTWMNFLALVLAATVLGWMSGSWPEPWVLRVIVLVGSALVLIYWSLVLLPAGHWRGRLMCVLLILAFLLLGTVQPAALTGGLWAAVGLSAFAWLFGNHYLTLRTAAPMPGDQARSLRRSWRGALCVVSAWPVILYLLETLCGIGGLAVLGYFVVGLLYVLEWGRARPRQAIGPMWDAWRSWCTYNARGIERPGLLESPSGSWAERLAVTCFVAFLVAASGHVDEQPPPAGDYVLHVDRATGAPLATAPPSPMASPLDLLATVGRWLSRSPFMLPAASALGWMIILQARAHRRRIVGPARFKAIINCLRQSRNPIERASIYVAEVVDDGAPLYVPVEVYGEHAHFLGDSGAGKTSLGLAPTIEQLATVRPASFVVIDLKADTPELFSTLAAVRDEHQRRTGQSIPLRHSRPRVDLVPMPSIH